MGAAVKALIYDVETSGLDPAVDQVIEVAVATYDVSANTMTDAVSRLIHATANPAQNVNGLAPEVLATATTADKVWRSLEPWFERADLVLAWNSDFDEQFTPQPLRSKRPFVDAMDLAWPRPTTSRSLISVALAHGVGVCAAHRALDDVLTLARLLERCHELGADVSAMLERGLRPKARFIVADRTFSEARNDQYRAAGFRFDRARKVWTRMLACDDAPGLPFAVIRDEDVAA